MQPLVVAAVISLGVILPLSMHLFVGWFGFIGSALSYALYLTSQALIVLGILVVQRPYKAECWPGWNEAWQQVFHWKPFAQFLHLGLGGIAASSECKCVNVRMDVLVCAGYHTRTVASHNSVFASGLCAFVTGIYWETM